MINQEALLEYSASIKRVKKQCLEAGLNEDEFRKLYFESLQSLEINNKAEPTKNKSIKTKCRLIIIAFVIVLCGIYNFKTVYSWVVCSLQDYVYPGLTLLRRLSIPLISLFPSLTDLYHESCLIQNPFFAVVDMDCWPCSTVNNIREVNDPKPVHQQHSAPFIYETQQQAINLEALKDMYFKYKDIFDKESPKVLVNNKLFIHPQEMFPKELLKEDNNLYIWRFNNMNVARLLRQVIPRPEVVPKYGQSTERFLIIDSSKQSFRIPDTECNFSFILSLSGSRVVKLVPAEECKLQCKALRVDLKEAHLLWYNWWYWRPVIEPSTTNATLIAHIGSYC